MSQVAVIHGLLVSPIFGIGIDLSIKNLPVLWSLAILGYISARSMSLVVAF